MQILCVFYGLKCRWRCELVSWLNMTVVSMVLVSFFCRCSNMTGQNSAVHVSQLKHTSWRLRDGALPGIPNAIAQTKDGYLWLGTESGLYRFDGQRFLEVTPPSGTSLRVISLFADDDGSLWVGANYRLFHLHDGRLDEVVHGSKFEHFLKTSSGELWSAVSKMHSPACKIREAKAQCWEDPSFPNSDVIGEDPSGGLWVSNEHSLEHRIHGKIVPQSDADKRLTNRITALSGDGHHSLWAGSHAPGQGPVLLSHDGNKWSRGPQLPGTNRSTDIISIFVDREGALWVGTSNRGLYRIVGTQIDHLDEAEGLSADDVEDIEQDREGSIWIATSSGLDEFRRSLVDTWTTREGLTADIVTSILADRSGRVWMSNLGGLDVLEGGGIHSYRPENGLPGQTVRGLAEDHLGRIWLGVDDDLYIFDGHSFHRVSGTSGAHFGPVLQMREDARGRMWVQTEKGLYRESAGGWTTLPVHFLVLITALEPDNSGGMWSGARGLPLFHIPSGTVADTPDRIGRFADVFRVFDVKGRQVFETMLGLATVTQGKTYYLDRHNGLNFKTILSSEMEPNGDFILMTDSAYLRVSSQDILRWISDPTAAVHPQSIERSDGALPGLSTFAPRSSLAPNGDVWFVNNHSAQRIDSKRLAFKQVNPPLVIETLVGDGKSYDAFNNLTLPAGTQDIHISYAALSYTNPQRINYKYLLRGFDRTWQIAGPRRDAFYTHLPPGTYTLAVTAEDQTGGWTSSSAAVTFSVAPRFYQTLWFKTLIGLVGGCILWTAYLTRIRYLARAANARFLERLSERERIARDLHDTFFQGIQGILLRFQTRTTAMPLDEPSRPFFQELLKQSDQVMLEGRELVLDLRERASEDQNLTNAFKTVCDELKDMFPITYQIVLQGQVRAIKPIVRQELFYIGREALLNAFQHSSAKSIEVELTFDARGLGLRIRDDGDGLDSKVKEAGKRLGHFGLQGMRERASKIGATLNVWSQTGAGTEVDVQVPADAAYGPWSKRWDWLRRLRDTQSA